MLHIGIVALLLAGCASANGDAEDDVDGADAGEAVSTDEGDDQPEDGEPDTSAGAPIDLSGEQVRIGTTAPGVLAMTHWKALDYLREWGADVQHEVLTETSGIIAIVGDAIDVASRGASEAVVGASQGEDVVGIASATPALNYAFVAQAGIESVEDLRGRTVAISRPTGADAIVMMYILTEAGLVAGSDVSIVQIGGGGERTAAMLTGEVDATLLFADGWLEIEQQTDEVVNLAYANELIPPVQASMFFAVGDYWEQNETLAVGIACATMEAGRWARDNPEDYVSYSLEHVEGVDEGIATASYEIGISVDLWPEAIDEQLSVENVTNLIEAMDLSGNLDAPVEASSVIDTTYLEEAASLGCGG